MNYVRLSATVQIKISLDMLYVQMFKTVWSHFRYFFTFCEASANCAKACASAKGSSISEPLRRLPTPLTCKTVNAKIAKNIINE